MADFFVVLLTVFFILLSSFLFWKWINERKLLMSKLRSQKRTSKAEVRKNRLKRFGKAKDENEDETLKATEAFTEEFRDLPARDPLDLAEETSLNLPKHLDKIKDESQLKQATTSNVGFNSDVLVRTETSSGSTKSPPKTKPNNTQKWVTLSYRNETKVPLPVTRPITNLDELRAWSEGFDEFNISSTPLRRASNKLEGRPRTLVCHDMKGGYLEDRFVQGFSSAECYRIYHWQYIDIFVYFSHNFITIPPPCWTNTAHQHGVQVLGTFITEWEDGAKQCMEIFKDHDSYKAVANQLIYMAKYYHFDGWLINVENPIQPAQINNLTEFVEYLTTEMHHHIPGSLVIWYDSVTYKGELKWQNELNPENRIFFDVSDGIFLNYVWKENNLTKSARGAGQDRRYDVYVGVDVFGRGCLGGGGWNTNKATSVIKNHDLSMALFAPGWVYEKYESSFKVSQDKFWNSIASDCVIHPLGSTLPFVTSLCQGYGNKVFKNGKVVLDNQWTHLGAQQVQPSYTNHIYSLGDQHGILITTMDHTCQDGYNGGGCLLLQGSTKPTQASSKAVVRLFKTDLLLPSTTLISFTTKLEPQDLMDVALQLLVDRNPTYIMLCPAVEQHAKDLKDDNIDSVDRGLLERYGVTRSAQLSSDHLAIAVGQEHYQLFAPVSGNHHQRLHALCGVEDLVPSWCTRYYLLAEKELKGSRIKEIRLVLTNKSAKEHLNDTSSTPFQLLVGEIKIIEAVSLRRPLPTVTSLHCRESDLKVQIKDNDLVALSLTLSWSYDFANADPWERFEIYHLADDNSTNLLGWSFALSFVVSELSIPRSQKQVKFAVQAVNRAHRKPSLQDCPTITIHWT